MAPPLLALAGIAKRHGAHRVLDGIDLAVPAGQFVALVGPSGSGKTTLLKTINRLVAPDAGTVRIDGRDFAREPAAALRRGIGYAFQGIGLFPHMTIAENIAIGLRLTGRPQAERSSRVAELLELVGLPREMAARYPRQLSGGQAQRAGVARALGLAPALMLMDEPFGALDPVTRDALGTAYRALHERLGLTTVMVTHDMTEALLLADRVVVLIDGRVRADAAPAELIAGHADAEVAELLAVPQRQAERLAALRAL